MSSESPPTNGDYRISEFSFDPTEYCGPLRQSEDGIWYAGEAASVSYPDQGHSNCFQLEENSFWFRHRNRCIAELVKQFPPIDGGPLFDIGGGNGYVTKGLLNAGIDSVLVEPGVIGAKNAKKRGVNSIVCATMEDAKFRDQSIGAGGLFDVLEHIEDDTGFLKKLRKILVPEGRLYFTVPAFSWLWSNEDIAAGHYRRYTSVSLKNLLESVGFKVNFTTYIFRPLPLPMLLLRVLPYRFNFQNREIKIEKAEQEHAVAGNKQLKLINMLLEGEIGNIKSRRHMAFGGSVLLCASKVA